MRPTKIYECNGECWLNIGGRYEILCSQCSGTNEERESIDNCFTNQSKELKERIASYSITLITTG